MPLEVPIWTSLNCESVRESNICGARELPWPLDGYLSSNSNRSDVYWLDQNGKKYFGESSIEKDSKNRYEVKNTLTIKASYEIHKDWIET